jgi:hypothetical protein
MHNPAVFTMRVVGVLSEEWSGRLGGLTIITSEKTGQQPVTTLTGQLAGSFGSNDGQVDWAT